MAGRPFLAAVHYDGTHFLGWQRQANGRTVQGECEHALQRLLGRRVPVIAAGRTDTGVHALGQAISFHVSERWTAAAMHRALNALLPRDIWVRRVWRMAPGFQARRAAVSRQYRYLIGTDPEARSPFRHPFEWALCRELDRAALATTAAAVVGEHDFRGLSAATPSRAHYRCRVTRAEWTERPEGAGVAFAIEADRFLHRMVRFLVGTMVDVALGRRPAADLTRLLTSSDNRAASAPAPPQGLYLVAVRYPTNLYAEGGP